jgi:hypothetical protein
MEIKYWGKVSAFANSWVDKIKIRKASSNFLFKTKERERTTCIELDPAIYHELKQQANNQKTTVTAIIYRAIEFYRTMNLPQDETKISIERKDNNPLLLLDGIAVSSSKERKSKQDQEVVEFETGRKPKW